MPDSVPPINWSIAKPPLFLTPLPDEFLPYVAQVTLLWGAYEEMFDDMLAAMIRESNKEPGRGWKTRNYKNRKPLFKKQAKLAFKSETLISFIDTLLNDSTALHRDRNIITHGRIVGVLKEQEGEKIEAIEAHAYLKKKPVILTLSEDVLSRLFHDLAHLLGRMQWLLDPDGDEEGLFPEHDKSELRDFWSRNPQIPPTGEKPRRLPQPAPRSIRGA